MKWYLFLAVCLLFSGRLLSQEKFTVKIPANDQKNSFAVSHLYSFMGAGINFAKSQGVCPYEYGKYIGKLFAPAWGEGNDFDRFVENVITHHEMTRLPSEPSIQVKKNADGSVTIISEKKMWRHYFVDDDQMATMSEFMDFMRGLYGPIADHMGARVTTELKDRFVVFTLTKCKVED